jgi:hypothetical protein
MNYKRYEYATNDGLSRLKGNDDDLNKILNKVTWAEYDTGVKALKAQVALILNEKRVVRLSYAPNVRVLEVFSEPYSTQLSRKDFEAFVNHRLSTSTFYRIEILSGALTGQRYWIAEYLGRDLESQALESRAGQDAPLTVPIATPTTGPTSTVSTPSASPRTVAGDIAAVQPTSPPAPRVVAPVAEHQGTALRSDPDVLPTNEAPAIAPEATPTTASLPALDPSAPFQHLGTLTIPYTDKSGKTDLALAVVTAVKDGRKDPAVYTMQVKYLRVKDGKLEEFEREALGELDVPLLVALDKTDVGVARPEAETVSTHSDSVRTLPSYTRQRGNYTFQFDSDSARTFGTYARTSQTWFTVSRSFDPDTFDPAKPEAYRGLPDLKYNGPVHVRGYYRKDGTYVRPHTRSAPGTKSRGSSGSSRSRSSGRRGR